MDNIQTHIHVHTYRNVCIHIFVVVEDLFIYISIYKLRHAYIYIYKAVGVKVVLDNCRGNQASRDI
jgi:hypothetical protein